MKQWWSGRESPNPRPLHLSRLSLLKLLKIVEDIKLGNAFQRNQLIANLCVKTMDYRGLGSGIIRALKADANIEFRNEASGDQFRAILWRTEQKTTRETEDKEKCSEKTTQKSNVEEGDAEKTAQKGSLKSDRKIIHYLKRNGNLTIPDLQNLIGLSRSGVKKILTHLKESGKIRRIGPDKSGHWEVCE